MGNPINGIDPFGLETYRYPGNRYGDRQLPGVGGCEKAIYAGGYIIGWVPCFDEDEDKECDEQPTREYNPYSERPNSPIESPVDIDSPDDGLWADGWDAGWERINTNMQIIEKHYV